MKRTNEVAQGIVDKTFSGRRKNNAEVHLGRDEVHAIASAAYEVGFTDGKAFREVRELRLGLRAPSSVPATDPDDAVVKAGEAQLDAIHAIAQYVLENESALRETLVRGGRLGDRSDLADDLHELLKGWRDAGTAVRDAALQAAKVVQA